MAWLGRPALAWTWEQHLPHRSSCPNLLGYYSRLAQNGCRRSGAGGSPRMRVHRVQQSVEGKEAQGCVRRKAANSVPEVRMSVHARRRGSCCAQQARRLGTLHPVFFCQCTEPSLSQPLPTPFVFQPLTLCLPEPQKLPNLSRPVPYNLSGRPARHIRSQPTPPTRPNDSLLILMRQGAGYPRGVREPPRAPRCAPSFSHHALSSRASLAMSGTAPSSCACCDTSRLRT